MWRADASVVVLSYCHHRAISVVDGEEACEFVSKAENNVPVKGKEACHCSEVERQAKMSEVSP